MKKIISIILLIFIIISNTYSYEKIYGPLTNFEKQVLSFGLNTSCKNIKQSDIPTIFIPGILASWYSEDSYKGSKIKRWIPDPITHAYDTLFYTFKQNGYDIKDVFYLDEFNTYIDGNPKQSLYLFGYDWKKDNKITARLLSDLVSKIRLKYQKENGCDIETVNIVAHSMGGLVARAMLEDMCATDDAIKNYYKDQKQKSGAQMYSEHYDGTGIKDIETEKCYNFTRVNNFITISTPHRGAPSSFPMWTKGDIHKTEAFIKSEVLKYQLGVDNSDELYKIIHGFDEKLFNGIVTIGQLLPDIKKTNSFNYYLAYLSLNNNKLKQKNHPVNSFLEELNSEKNIKKMLSNISGKYTSYYSSLTGNNKNKENNIIEYNISNKYFDTLSYQNFYTDMTSNYRGKDIYSFFPEKPKNNIYNIRNIITDEKGLGGDGTVPTQNLLLIPNDTGTLFSDKKFESKKIQCYEDEIFTDPEGIILEKYETQLTKKVGKLPLELCSHTKMPTLISIQVYNKIAGKNLFEGLSDKQKLEKEQQLLYKYLGFADYKSDNNPKNILEYDLYFEDLDIIEFYNNHIKLLTYFVDNFTGIKTFSRLVTRFNDNYNNLFEDKLAINKFIQQKNDGETKRIDINFGGGMGDVYRYEILSPINIIIEDEQGRRIGIDPDTGMIINEIPGAWTSGDTEGSNEPEFFLIPKTGTGTVMHKIHTYGTGDGEYHIVMNEIKQTPPSIPPLLGEGSKTVSLVIAGVAKKGEEEKYVVGIEGNKAGFVKIDSSNYRFFRQEELDNKYGSIFEKLKEILDKKYSKRKISKLKQRLTKMKDLGFGKFKDNEKVVYLIGKILEYLE